MERFSLLFFKLVIETVCKVDEEVVGIVLLESFELKITKKLQEAWNSWSDLWATKEAETI